MKIERLNNIMKRSECGAEGEAHCQQTNCGTMAEWEVGVIIDGKEYYWNLCTRCKDELEQKSYKGWTKMDGRQMCLDSVPMFYLTRHGDSHEGYNMTPTELDAIANKLPEWLNGIDFEKLHKEHLEGS